MRRPAPTQRRVTTAYLEADDDDEDDYEEPELDEAAEVRRALAGYVVTSLC